MATDPPNFKGHGGRECGEHRTTGGRAWCLDCTTWCSLDGPCPGCELPALRTQLAERDLIDVAAYRDSEALHRKALQDLAERDAEIQRRTKHHYLTAGQLGAAEYERAALWDLLKRAVRARDALEAAAPLVVAAELERLADEIERRAKEMLIGVEQMKPDVAAAVGAGYGARMAEARRLRARASELRGDGR